MATERRRGRARPSERIDPAILVEREMHHQARRSSRNLKRTLSSSAWSRASSTRNKRRSWPH